MDIPPVALVAFTAVTVPTIGLWLTVLRDRRTIANSRAERDSKVDLRLERLDTKMETVWGAFTAQLLTVLHHPDPAKIVPDALLKRYEASLIKPDAINAVQLNELIELMIKVVQNEGLELDERTSAMQLLKLVRHHPLWSPTPEAELKLESVIGPDLHPGTKRTMPERSTEHTDQIIDDIRDKLEDKR